MTTRVEASSSKSQRRLPLAPAPVAEVRDVDAERPKNPESPLRVGDLARRTGKTVRALHLYEELGLLEPARRTGAGYRLYSADSVTRVEWISRLQDAGLSLPEIRELLADWGSSPSAPGAMRKVTELFGRKLEATRAHIQRLRELESELSRSLAYLETCDTCEPQRVVSACPSCDRHPCDSHPPVLVAGFHPPSPTEQ
jgi:MerR family transcriptional regulator, copper efflux regulator